MPYLTLEITDVALEIGCAEGRSSTTVGLSGKLSWRKSIRTPGGEDIGAAGWNLQITHLENISEFAEKSGAVGVCAYHESLDDPEHGFDAGFTAHFGLSEMELGRLVSAWQVGKKLRSVTLEVDDLDYGWEPDGSGLVWDTAVRHRIIRSARVLISVPEEEEVLEDPFSPTPALPAPYKSDLQELGSRLKSIENSAHYILAVVVLVAVVYLFR